MSLKYSHGERVSNEDLTKRLNELADFVTKGPDVIRRNFGMSVPAQLDRDADLVLSAAAMRIAEQDEQLQKFQYSYVNNKVHEYGHDVDGCQEQLNLDSLVISPERLASMHKASVLYKTFDEWKNNIQTHLPTGEW